MSQVILETGNCAEEPYFIEKFYVNLYSVEELCYVLVENAELLDQEIMDRKLVQWLDEECGLNELAHNLYLLLNQKASSVAFVGTILEYVRLYPEEEIKRAEDIIRQNDGLDPYERKKAKADYLMGSRRYYAALRQYHFLLSELPETEKTLRAEIYYNIGVACAKMFLFERASEWFLKAYGTDGEEDSLLRYLAALRIHYQDKEYITFIADHPEYHNASLKVERMVKRASGQFEGTDENRMLFTLHVCKEEGSSTAGTMVAYYDEIDKLTERLKEQYREYTV